MVFGPLAGNTLLGLGSAARASNGRYPSRCPLSAGALPGVEHIPWRGCHPLQLCVHACPLSWDVAFRSAPFSKSCGWPKPAGPRSAPACRLSGDTLSPGLLLLRSFIRSAPVWPSPCLDLCSTYVRAGAAGSGPARASPLLMVSRAWGCCVSWLQPLYPLPASLSLELWCSCSVPAVRGDCAFSWLSAVAASPLRPVHAPLQEALSAHIESVVSQVHPGAGHGVAQPPVLSNRRIKRWLYRFLQRRFDPVTVSAALAACDGALGSPPGLSVGFRLCIENLRREGGMVLTVVAGEPAIALA